MDEKFKMRVEILVVEKPMGALIVFTAPLSKLKLANTNTVANAT